MKVKRYSLCLDDKTYNTIKEISNNTGDSIADVTRKLIRKGLAREYIDDSKDMIVSMIRDTLRAELNSHVERLAKIESKSAHMAATAAFLNVQALMDLVPTERRRNVREMYEKARIKAVAYMKPKTNDRDVEEFKLNVLRKFQEGEITEEEALGILKNY